MNNKGLTLVEILIVVAILGAVIGLGMPQLRSVFRTNLRSSAFQIASLSKYAYDASVIKGRIHRIAFDFEGRSYKLQMANTEELVSIVDEDKEKKKTETETKEEAKEEATKPEPFVAASGDAGKEHKLPSGIDIDSIENLDTKKKYTDDVAYLYFFPQGATENVIIRLSGKRSNTGFYSIKINPLNGKTSIEGRYIETE